MTNMPTYGTFNQAEYIHFQETEYQHTLDSYAHFEVTGKRLRELLNVYQTINARISALAIYTKVNKTLVKKNTFDDKLYLVACLPYFPTNLYIEA